MEDVADITYSQNIVSIVLWFIGQYSIEADDTAGNKLNSNFYTHEPSLAV